MGLFSLLRKSKQESAPDDSDFYSRAEEESKAVRSRTRRKQAVDPVDPVLPEKKRARQRLIGALALVLAAIIGLPMILDSAPKPIADDIAIQIPSKDKQPLNAIKTPLPDAANAVMSASLERKEGDATETPAAGSRAAVTKLPNTTVAKQGAAIDAGTVTATGKDSQAKQDSGVADMARPATTKSAVKAGTQAESKIEHARKSKGEQIPGVAEKDADAARAMAILEGKIIAEPGAGKTRSDKRADSFTVQVAALASRDKINELRGKLNKAGIQSYTQNVATASGERTRIRIGPFASREEADKMRARLGKLGLNGKIVPASR
jgi:DedD protein